MNGFSLFVALRYTLSRRQSHLVAFISRVSTIGLVLAVSILITVMSVMNGFERELRERILAIVPHATLSGFGQTQQWPEYLQLAQQHPGVSAAAPFSYRQALVMHQQSVRAALLYGIDPQHELQGGVLQQLLGEQLLSLEQPGTVIVGSRLADKLGISAGQSLRVVLPAAGEQHLPAVDYLTVSAVLHSGTELDQRLLLTHRSRIASLSGNAPDAVDGIRIQVDDLFAARAIADQLAELTGLYQVRDWSRSHGNLFHAVQMSRKLVLLLVLIIIAVAAFNVVSTLVLAVNDKAADIAILRTMGCRDGQIQGIFILQGLLIGLLGVGIGVALGVLLSVSVSQLVSVIERLSGVHFLQSEVYPVDHLPSQLLASDVAVVAGAALLLSILASWLPAWLARRIAPARILRYE